MSTIARPSPLPSEERASSARLKRSNARARGTRPGTPARVGDVQLDRAVRRPRLELARPVAVTERVVDQVGQRLFETRAVGRRSAGPAAARPRSRGPPRAARAVEPRADRREQLRRPRTARPRREPALGGPRDHQQVLGELDRRSASLDRRADRRRAARPRRSALAQRELELGPVQGQRRAQLVAGVVDEPCARARTPPRAAPSISFSVSPRRVSSSPAGGDREPLARPRGRDLLRPPAHRLHRPQRRRRRPSSRRARRAAAPPARRSASRVARFASASSRSSREAPTTSDRRPGRRHRPASRAAARDALEPGSAVVIDEAAARRGARASSAGSRTRPPASCAVESSTLPSGLRIWAKLSSLLDRDRAEPCRGADRSRRTSAATSPARERSPVSSDSSSCVSRRR